MTCIQIQVGTLINRASSYDDVILLAWIQNNLYPNLGRDYEHHMMT